VKTENNIFFDLL